MAIPANTYTTYTSIGGREDLIDVITNISPVSTFLTSNTGSTQASGRVHEFQTDALASPAANAVIEGDDATSTAVTPTVRLSNQTQILRKVFQVTDTEEVISKAGRSTESGYQTEMRIKELANDIEYALLINASAVTGATGTARQMKGILGYIATNVTTGTGTGNEALTESMLNDNLQLIWAQGGFPSTVLAGAFQKRQISGFSTNTREIMASAKEITSAIDIYNSDFGTVRVHLHHILNTTASGTLVILGDMGLWVKAWLRPVVREELARTGASRKYMIEAELTLEGRQEKGSGKITQLTTA